MRVAIVGYSTEGKASCDYYRSRGDEVTICDQDTSKVIPAGVDAQLGDDYLADLDQFDVIVRTAGMHPRLILEKNPAVAAKITTHINEFLRVCPTRNVIGVTGTKGKGTTSSLISHMLEAAGKQVFLGGNIGIPVLGMLPDITADSWVVLELSSFQLIDIQHSPQYAVCLMVVPEHLNWHADLSEYTTAKSQLFAHQSPTDTAIYFADNETSHSIASAGPAQQIPYYATPGAYVNDDEDFVIADQVICNTTDIKLLGQHNWQNVCAAITAVWAAGIHDTTAIASALASYSGLEHRLEFVREYGGCRYYNDSFGTTPETAMVALQAFQEPKIIILGGSDKGADYQALAQVVATNNVRHALLIGAQAGRIEAALAAAGFHDYVPGGQSMNEIVATAHAQAQPGDVIILSPACASFDMFHDYKDRGNQFKAAVLSLGDR